MILDALCKKIYGNIVKDVKVGEDIEKGDILADGKVIKHMNATSALKMLVGIAARNIKKGQMMTYCPYGNSKDIITHTQEETTFSKILREKTNDLSMMRNVLEKQTGLLMEVQLEQKGEKLIATFYPSKRHKYKAISKKRCLNSTHEV